MGAKLHIFSDTTKWHETTFNRVFLIAEKAMSAIRNDKVLRLFSCAKMNVEMLEVYLRRHRRIILSCWQWTAFFLREWTTYRNRRFSTLKFINDKLVANRRFSKGLHFRQKEDWVVTFIVPLSATRLLNISTFYTLVSYSTISRLVRL